VVRRMVKDLLLPVEIVAVPTRRAADGLALSSRNRYLDAGQRQVAAELHACLRDIRRRLHEGAAAGPAIEAGRARLARAGFAVDYLALVEAETLEPAAELAAPARLIAAARLGPVRLLDNLLV
ncbi:MAG TPA: pantoate--beta-alanine ligase, partial [Acetobacteraceae bacterium]|nr:pantoate--beta-alanine ligase [Acetobacteraceae bacterium]